MTNSLIEKALAAVMLEKQCGLFIKGTSVACDDPRAPDHVREGKCDCRSAAIAVVAAVLDHFSDPANVTQRMDHAAWDDAQTLHETRPIKTVIAAAMKAAKEKLSSDIKPKSTHPG